MTSPDGIWAGFSHDPRLPGNAPLRASDQDRDVVHQLLAEAYADGRLDRDELDVRTEQTQAARTLGELPPLVVDLLPTTTLSPVAPDQQALRVQAERKHRRDVADAFGTFLFPSIVCVVIWVLTMSGGFFWPGIVMAVTGANLLRTAVQRQSTIDAEIRRLERKQAKQLRARPEEGDDT